jgi:hypothetical protein
LYKNNLQLNLKLRKLVLKSLNQLLKKWSNQLKPKRPQKKLLLLKLRLKWRWNKKLLKMLTNPSHYQMMKWTS